MNGVVGGVRAYGPFRILAPLRVSLAVPVAASAEAGLNKKNPYSSSSLRKLAPRLGLDGLLVVRVGKERVRVVVLPRPVRA